MIKIDGHQQFLQLSKALNMVGREQLPKVLARAATITAYQIKEKLVEHVLADFDRPTPTTAKSLYVKAAKAPSVEARVWFKDAFTSGIPADKYLQPQVQGGTRGHKRFEKALIAKGIITNGQYAIPSKDILNAFGNVPGGLSIKILSGLSAAETTSGVTANASSSRRSKKKWNARRFFVAKIKNTTAIWEKKTTAFGDGIRPLFIIVDRKPSYSRRLDFFGIAEKEMSQRAGENFTKALDDVFGWVQEKIGKA